MRGQIVRKISRSAFLSVWRRPRTRIQRISGTTPSPARRKRNATNGFKPLTYWLNSERFSPLKPKGRSCTSATWLSGRSSRHFSKCKTCRIRISLNRVPHGWQCKQAHQRVKPRSRQGSNKISCRKKSSAVAWTSRISSSSFRGRLRSSKGKLIWSLKPSKVIRSRSWQPLKWWIQHHQEKLIVKMGMMRQPEARRVSTRTTRMRRMGKS